jgi:hypothetical protein
LIHNAIQQSLDESSFLRAETKASVAVLNAFSLIFFFPFLAFEEGEPNTSAPQKTCKEIMFFKEIISSFYNKNTQELRKFKLLSNIDLIHYDTDIHGSQFINTTGNHQFNLVYPDICMILQLRNSKDAQQHS